MVIEASSLAIIGSLVTAVYILVRVVEHLILRKLGNGKDGGLTKDQSEQLNQLYTLHNRFDENGVPRWYVSHDLQEFPREMLDALKTHIADDRLQFQSMNRELVAIRSEQTLMNNRINDLITSQNRLVDRMGDLITRLEKTARG